jgi:hypothetical protein
LLTPFIFVSSGCGLSAPGFGNILFVVTKLLLPKALSAVYPSTYNYPYLIFFAIEGMKWQKRGANGSYM